MDRSFLSNAAVVEASRKFVCIRLMTYEDEKEAEFMKSIYLGRSGQLENTTFAILSPDGKTKLTKTGRGPFHEYRSGRDMAAGMNQIALRYQQSESAKYTDPKLPEAKSVDLALNVSAADNLPLVVVYGKDEKQIEKLNSQLRPLVWSDEFAGEFCFASTNDAADLKPILGNHNLNSILVVEPDQFGVSGKVVARLDASTTKEKIALNLKLVLAKHKAIPKSHDSHVQLGIQLGLDWQSEIPETDQQSVRARQRARGNK